jgi:hypothetical protein
MGRAGTEQHAVTEARGSGKSKADAVKARFKSETRVWVIPDGTVRRRLEETGLWRRGSLLRREAYAADHRSREYDPDTEAARRRREQHEKSAQSGVGQASEQIGMRSVDAYMSNELQAEIVYPRRGTLSPQVPRLEVVRSSAGVDLAVEHLPADSNHEADAHLTRSAGRGKFDAIYVKGNEVFIVEAKGGVSSGSRGTRNIGGRHYEQGTPEYLDDVIAAMRTELETIPHGERSLYSHIADARAGDRLRYLQVSSKIRQAQTASPAVPEVRIREYDVSSVDSAQNNSNENE